MVGSGSALNLEYKSHGTMVCVPPSPITPVLQGPGGPVVVHWGRVGDTCSIYLCVVSLKNLQRGKPLLGSGRFFFRFAYPHQKIPRRAERTVASPQGRASASGHLSVSTCPENMTRGSHLGWPSERRCGFFFFFLRADVHVFCQNGQNLRAILFLNSLYLEKNLRSAGPR